MSEFISGKVIKGVGGIYTVLSDRKLYDCLARKKTKFNGENIIVGDNVYFSDNNGRYTIESIINRKNLLNRPKVANIDIALIVITTYPMADLLLLDKLIINCIYEKIEPVILINKIDIIDYNFIEIIEKEYKNIIKILKISTITQDGIKELKEFIGNSTCCLIGQSAVGKTSLLNALINSNCETGELSSKTERGRHTTRHNEIHSFGNGLIIDTAGFSMLEEINIPSNELCLYYPDFSDYASYCKYNMCTHINEPFCNVKKAIEENKISKNRYDRYCTIFNEIKENEKRRY